MSEDSSDSEGNLSEHSRGSYQKQQENQSQMQSNIRRASLDNSLASGRSPRSRGQSVEPSPRVLLKARAQSPVMDKPPLPLPNVVHIKRERIVSVPEQKLKIPIVDMSGSTSSTVKEGAAGL